MYKYITRISFIILLFSLTACETCSQEPPTIQDNQEKQPTNQEEELASEIKELAIQRKKQITHLIDEWKQGKSSISAFSKLLKQGDIEAIYEYKKNRKGLRTEEEVKGYLSALKEKVKKENKDYSFMKEEIAILEKDLYKLYESYFLAIYIKRVKKQGVDEYFKKLEEKEKNGTLKNNSKQKKQLQLIRNWKAVEPTLKLEQEKRAALKKLQEVNKA